MEQCWRPRSSSREGSVLELMREDRLPPHLSGCTPHRDFRALARHWFTDLMMAGVILLASTPFCILSRFKQGSFVNSFNPKCELSPRIEGPLASWECQGSDRQHFRGEGT